VKPQTIFFQMKPLSYVGDIDILILIDCREFLKISILNWIVSKSIAVIDVALSLDRLLTPNQINNCVTGIRYFRTCAVRAWARDAHASSRLDSRCSSSQADEKCRHHSTSVLFIPSSKREK
jgi:hypothetical protein